MRTALLIGLLAASLAGAAHAQMSPFRNPYGMGPAKNPYDLPKSYYTNPYDRDYTKPDPATRGPGYRNVDGSLPAQRAPTPSYGGYYGSYGAYGSRPSGSDNYGVSSPRYRQNNPNCSKPGIVC